VSVSARHTAGTEAVSVTGHQARTALLTATALMAFAANSLLCRLALGDDAIDPGSFTMARLVSGAAALWLLRLLSRGPHAGHDGGTWLQGALLFLYAVAFSFAYLSLDVGTGALILFASVQATMILSGLRAGERPHAREWTGLVLALGGLAYLVSPGLTAPSPAGSALMAVAGIAWGAYSLHGRGPAPTASHELGHVIGLAHIISTEGVRPAFTMGVTPDGEFAPRGRLDMLEPATIRMLETVYDAGLTPGSTRGQFEAVGLVLPEGTTAVPPGASELGSRTHRITQEGIEIVILKPFCQ
jgi:hypothetical protein